ncbi:MAG: glutamate formimidoyltransferase [Firmicutes bacterium]|nr:glutamate formimidoyltransferase [Alicyclobacillaceae bacterium]MCL6497479.1 glutamate formimidoyltransferase [Bacillota bacterium]
MANREASDWFECVPNFSEGRRPWVWERIGRAAEAQGATLLGAEGDPDHHRAVVTVAGGAAVIYEAALAMARVAVEAIDLRQHRGTHPRIGAVDVVPVVPLGATPMAAAVALAERIGRRLAEDLDLPVYLYGEAARTPKHRLLAELRRGGFEGLAAQLAEDPPDFGPARPHPTAGAVAVGARRLLIAFNVYLDTQDLAVARNLARRLRESSGGLPGVQALAMDTRQRGHVQVSMNLVNYPTTPLPVVLETLRAEATRLGVGVAGSELVGLMPFEALLDTARHYLALPDLRADQILEWRLARRPWETGDGAPAPGAAPPT